MKKRFPTPVGLLTLVCLLATPLSLGGEIVDEIVAWINGEIITMSDYKEEEQVVLAQAYRDLTGAELDQYLVDMRENLLMQMIDRKILADQAQRIYDLNTMGGVFLEQFKEQQNIASDDELEMLLEQEGMSIEDLTTRLVEMFAPEEVIRFEVSSRISVSDGEVEAFYEANKNRFVRAAEVTLREIVILAPEGTDKSEALARAEAARQRVLDGVDFAEVATEVSDSGSSENGGLLGTMMRKDLAEHLAEAAFETPVGEVSEIIEASYGFHILFVEERAEDELRPLEEMQDRIREVLHQSKYATELEAYLTKVRDESEWCVKKKYQDKLQIPNATTCDET
jgi:parvulin-like peptidyl-prolyl isomerase